MSSEPKLNKQALTNQKAELAANDSLYLSNEEALYAQIGRESFKVCQLKKQEPNMQLKLCKIRKFDNRCKIEEVELFTQVNIPMPML